MYHLSKFLLSGKRTGIFQRPKGMKTIRINKMPTDVDSQETYHLNIDGKIDRDLPLITLPGADARIASFVMLGDTELNEICAELLHNRVREDLSHRGLQFDIIAGSEAKSIALLQAVANRFGQKRYVVMRKGIKNYMQEPLTVSFASITTAGEQTLVLDGLDVNRVCGKNVLLVDDVVSTGGTLIAARKLVEKAGGRVVLCASVLLENEEPPVPDLVFLERIPFPA